MYDADTLTDRSERFLAAELIREKLFRLLGDELPYDSTVVIERFEELPKLRRIDASILVERESAEADRARRGRRADQAHRDRGARRHGAAVRRQGLSGMFVRCSGWAGSEQSLRTYGYE